MNKTLRTVLLSSIAGLAFAAQAAVQPPLGPNSPAGIADSPSTASDDCVWVYVYGTWICI